MNIDGCLKDSNRHNKQQMIMGLRHAETSCISDFGLIRDNYGKLCHMLTISLTCSK